MGRASRQLHVGRNPQNLGKLSGLFVKWWLYIFQNLKKWGYAHVIPLVQNVGDIYPHSPRPIIYALDETWEKTPQQEKIQSTPLSSVIFLYASIMETLFPETLEPFVTEFNSRRNTISHKPSWPLSPGIRWQTGRSGYLHFHAPDQMTKRTHRK